MAKFRTKPFEIDAVQFTGENYGEVLDFTGYRTVDGYEIPLFCAAGTYAGWDDPDIFGEVYDKLHSSWVGVKADQWIIRGQKGEYYPCDPDIFAAKYEEIGEFADTAFRKDRIKTTLTPGEHVVSKGWVEEQRGRNR
jgi:hypothetical protein